MQQWSTWSIIIGNPHIELGVLSVINGYYRLLTVIKEVLTSITVMLLRISLV